MAERFARWWRDLARDGKSPDSLAAYAFALVCVLAATAVRAAFDLIADNVLPFATYYPAILLSALACGLGAGMFATMLSLVIIWWWAWSSSFGAQAVNILVFLLSAGTMLAVAELYRRAIARVHAEEKRRAFLVRELEHRGKNTFAIVQSIVTQTLQGQSELAETIVGRIRSVSATNDIITKSEHQRAGLKAILERELHPYDRARVRLRGGDIQLEAELARSVALIVHELATNAAKYGALCKPDGQLSVEWTADGGRLLLDWIEKNGPLITKPFEPGFGAKLITRLLKSHDGEVTPEFRPDGLCVRLSFALPAEKELPPHLTPAGRRSRSAGRPRVRDISP